MRYNNIKERKKKQYSASVDAFLLLTKKHIMKYKTEKKKISKHTSRLTQLYTVHQKEAFIGKPNKERPKTDNAKNTEWLGWEIKCKKKQNSALFESIT